MPENLVSFTIATGAPENRWLKSVAEPSDRLERYVEGDPAVRVTLVTVVVTAGQLRPHHHLRDVQDPLATTPRGLGAPVTSTPAPSALSLRCLPLIFFAI